MWMGVCEDLSRAAESVAGRLQTPEEPAWERIASCYLSEVTRTSTNSANSLGCGASPFQATIGLPRLALPFL